MLSVQKSVRYCKAWLQNHRQLVRRALYGLGIVLAVSVLTQLAYPRGRALPFAHVAGQQVGLQTTADAAATLTAYYQKATLMLRTTGKTITKPLQEIGIDVDAKAAAAAAADYPFWQRLIPFSAFSRNAFGQTQVQFSVDDERLAYFVQAAHTDLRVAAQNAGVSVKDGKAVLVPARSGQDYPEAALRKSIRSAHLAKHTTLRLRPTSLQPARSSARVKAVLADAQKIIDRPLVLGLPDEKLTIDKVTIGTWLDFPEDPATMGLSVSLKSGAISGYLAALSAKIDKAPGTVVVSTLDGGEIGRSGNGSGRGLDTAQAASLIEQSLRGQAAGDVVLPIITIPAKITYSRTYSNTQAGLAALLKDIVAAKGNYGIAVTELGGQGRTASASGSKQFVSTSTYKLPVAYAVFKEIAAGRMGWADAVYGGKNAETCFEAMIVQSDNACAKAFGEKIGWAAVENYARGIGMASTKVIPNGNLTTANDLALFMTKLQAGTLVSASDRDRLLSAMKRQVYRSGIPAGTGVSVADKVGFVDGYLHDAGIVYGPKGTYVMIVLSNGSSWAQVADAAKQIHQYLSK